MITDKITAFIEKYKGRVSQLNERIAATSQQIENTKVEARFIREKELPDSSIRRVLEDDSTLEAKLSKKLARLEAELLKLQEEETILIASLQQYKLQAAEQLKQYTHPFNDERKIAEAKAFKKMMAAKREYVETIKAKAEVLHQYQAIDVQIQQVELAAGLRKDIYNILPVQSAPIQSHLNRHEGIYLAFPHEDIQKIIKRQPIDLGYLEKYKHQKAL